MPNGISIPNKEEIYTSDEQFIGYYGNSKLYRRVYEFGAVSANTDTVVLNTTSFTGATIISLTGVGHQSDNSIVGLGHYYAPTSANSAIWYNNLRVFVRSSAALTKGYFTVLYTK